MTTTFIALIAAAFAIWAMVSISKSNLKPNHKAIWFAVVILLPLIGPIIYWFRFRN